MELWDAYDRSFNKLAGVTLVRGEPIPDGMFHLSCCVIVRHIDGTYLLMRRESTKHLGGMWEVTAGGSAIQGETPEEGALRELREKTGITSGELTLLGNVVNEKIRSVFADYIFITDVQKDSVVLQAGETVDYRWVSPEELMAIPQESLITPKDLLAGFIPELRN